MYKIEVLIATMHKENEKDIIILLDDMDINSDCVVVSQCNKEGVEKFNYKNYNVVCIYSKERGLSRSRNLALQYATADIVMIADDDVQYIDGYTEIVVATYRTYSKYDIITFKTRNNKKYLCNNKKINRISSRKITSSEITMKLSSVRGISFNVLFGTGSSCFLHGEENIFLNSCIRRKRKILYIPQTIAYSESASFVENKRPSTWFAGYNREYMIDQGALYYELSPFLFLPSMLQFVFRKYSLYKKNMNCLTVIYYMVLGVSKYKKILSNMSK